MLGRAAHRSHILTMTDRRAAGEAPAFLCDEMLGGMARWLRAAGYDTGMAERGAADGVLVAKAIAEHRLLLTRDRRMIERRGAWPHVVVLREQSREALALELRRKLSISWWFAPFTRCMLCNTELECAPNDQRGHTWCPTCRKIYWPGSHTWRIAAALKRWQEIG